MGAGLRGLAAIVALSAAAGACGGGSGPGAPRPATPRASPSAPAPPTGTPQPIPTRSAVPVPSPTLPGYALVSVAVATVWRSPAAPRPVDRPALRNPVDIRGWLAAMTLDERRDLAGRADTQALLGDRLLVLAERGGWAEVRVPDQPTPLAAAGYPGWVPLAQLSFAPAAPAASWATVVTPTAWLYPAGTSTRMEISFGTRLPVRARDGDWVSVAVPGGGGARVAAAAVAVAPAGAAALPATGSDVVRAARQFIGLPYLWAGTSGFGFDCSGLTYLDYRVRGVRIPRDADAQAGAGQPVSRAALRAGDLVFFASGGVVHHVGIYVGDGLLLESPQTGAAVRTVALSAQPYASEYWGARRYLG